MKKWYLFTVTILLSLLLGGVSQAQSSFTTGNLVVYQVGNGTATLGGNATRASLVEYTTAGTVVQTIVMDTATAGARLTNLGTSTSEGFLQRSQNSHFLSFGGYDAAGGTVASTYITNATAANDAARVCAKVGANGIIDYSTKVTGFSGNIRSVYTTDGTAFWAATSNAGVQYVPLANSGTGTQLSSAPTNTRVTSVYNGQLYVTSSSSPIYGVATIGSNIPTTSGQSTTLLSGFPANTSAGAHSPYGFAISPDGTVIYVADDGTPGTTGGGIQKWVLNSGTWSRIDTLSSGTTGVRAITVDWSNFNSSTQYGAVIYAIDASASTANKLVKVTDLGSRNSSFTTLATAPANTAFRGVAFAPTPYPTLSVTGALNSFGGVASGSYSAEQTFTVTGANLTGNVVITAPTDFEVSTTTGSGFSSSVTVTPVNGTVSSATIYVRFHPSGTSGSVSNNVTVATNEVTTTNVPVAGIELAAEPTTQSTITFGTVDNSSIVLNLAGGNGTNRIVVAHAVNAVSFSPTDGVASTGVNSNFSSATDIGSGNKIVYDGTGTTVTVTGLSAGVTYYFASYEYNVATNNSQNYLTTSPGTNNTTTVAVYVWNGGSSTDYTGSSNWTPARTTPLSTDILNFNTGSAITVTAVPTQTVGQVVLSNNTTVTLQPAVTAAVLTISGGTGTDLSIPTGSALNISGTYTLKLYLGTGATAAISGKMTFSGAAHTFDAKDSAAINFLSGAVFTQGTGATGYIFTNAGQNNSVIFNSGATFVQMAGSNPFGLSQPSSKVVFKTGSLFSMQANQTPSFSGRTYGDFELNYASASISPNGGAGVSIDNLTITAGIMNYTMTGSLNYIKGNVTVASGAALYFGPSSTSTDTINFAGSAAQTFTIAGACSTSTGCTLNINNANGLSLSGNRNLIAKGILRLSSGTCTVGSDSLTLYNPITGTATNLAADNTSTIILGGTAANVNLPSSITTLNNLTLNNTNGTSLQGDLTVSGNLTLTSGNLTLGSHNLTLGSAAAIVGTPSATNQVVATGSGQIQKLLADSQALPCTIVFPVGDNTNYTPMSITLTSGTLSSAKVGVNLSASKFAQNTSSTDYLNRSWTITGSGVSSAVYNATFTYAPTDVNGTEANLYGGLYDGSKWTLLNPTNTSLHQLSITGLSNIGTVTGGQGSAFVIIPDVPVLATPNNYNNSAVAPLNLVWNKSARATKYRVEVATDYSFSQIIVNDSTVTDTTKQITNLSPLTRYYWRVSAIDLGGESNFSSTRIFLTMGTPTTVNLIQPAENAVNQPINLSFVWTSAADQYGIIPTKKATAGAVKSPKSPHTVSYYWFELAQDTVAMTGLLRDTSLTDTTKQVNGLSNSTTYYWRVRSQNEAGWSTFTYWNTFSTIASVPDVPVLVSPADFTMNVGPSVRLYWNQSSGAQKYRLQLYVANDGWNRVYTDSTLTDTFATVSQLQPLSEYAWRVSAINSIGESALSGYNIFFTIGPPVVANLISPADASTDQPVNITFTWNKPADQVIEPDFKKIQKKVKKVFKKPALGDTYWFEMAKDSVSLDGLVRDTVLSDTSKTVNGLDGSMTYFWRLKSKNGMGWSDFTKWNSFTTVQTIPDPPVLAAPTNGNRTVYSPVMLKWNKSSLATKYHVEVSISGLFKSTVVDDTTADTTQQVSGLSTMQTYYWRVSAISGSGESDFSDTWFFITMGTPTLSTLIQPANKAVDQPVSLSFVWSSSADQYVNPPAKKVTAKAVKSPKSPNTVSAYWFQLAKDSSFSTIVLSDTAVTDTTYTVNSLANATAYYWRVSSKNESGWSGFTKGNSFTTIIAVPDAPVLASPADKSGNLTLPVTVAWNKTANAASYRLQVATDSLFSGLIFNDSTLTDTAKTLASLLNNTTYYWRVNAKDLAGTSVYAKFARFTTIVAVPDAPVLVSPTSGASNTAASLKFVWHKAKDAATYHIQVASDNAFAKLVADTTIADTAITIGGLLSKTTYFWRVKSTNVAGASAFTSGSSFTTDVKWNQSKDITYALLQNFPNPFNPTTVIRYSIPQASQVTLKVYNVLGKEVATLVNQYQNSGYYELTFDASRFASGVYYYQIKAGNSVLMKKMILMK